MTPPHPRTDPADQIGELRLVALPASVGQARRFTRLQLRRWGLAELTDDAELLISELLTNAVRATAGLLTPAASRRPVDNGRNMVIVRLRLAVTGLYIEVGDTHPDPPAPAHPTEFDERGRGLHLIMALSEDWGHYPSETGKIVWVRVAR
jgi:anti-sigma regulatory factor (Ser/Thr protein kinase)